MLVNMENIRSRAKAPPHFSRADGYKYNREDGPANPVPLFRGFIWVACSGTTVLLIQLKEPKNKPNDLAGPSKKGIRWCTGGATRFSVRAASSRGLSRWEPRSCEKKQRKWVPTGNAAPFKMTHKNKAMYEIKTKHCFVYTDNRFLLVNKIDKSGWLNLNDMN